MFTVRETKNPFEAERFLTGLNTPFTQSHLYADWQTKREVRRFIIEKDAEIVAYFQAVKFPLIFGKSYYYIPYGPVIKEPSLALLKFIYQNVSMLKDDKNVIYVRFDFFPKIEDQNLLNYLKKTFCKVPKGLIKGSNFQPRQEWFLNLEKTEEGLLKDVNKKTRYAIRVAEKNNVKIKIVEKNFMDYFPDFYRLMQVTGERSGFSLHPKEYYENIFLNLDKGNSLKSFLAVAYLGEQILVIDLIIVYGPVATYLFSGSSNEYRNLTPTYLAQWQSIIQAKKIGCTQYNFGGVCLIDGEQKKEWAGFTDYKIKFGGYAVTHSDFYDIIWGRFWYFLYAFRKLIK